MSSKRQTAVEKAVAESEHAREREGKINELRSLFVPFGHRIAAHFVSEFLRYGHLKASLRLLNLTQTNDFEQQCNLLYRHLEQVGPRALLMHIESGTTSKRLGDFDLEPSLPPQGDLTDQILGEAEARLIERMVRSRTPVRTPGTNDDTITICPKTGRPMKNGQYVERRSGKDRRSGQDRRRQGDRRQRLDVVFVNKRFGGDRRSGKDRRSGQDRRKG
ncbi:MAG: hypothetical protein Kow0059_11150 [Candidatus Sumerlaeia bacterium]